MDKLHDDYIRPLLEQHHRKHSNSNFNSSKVEFSLNDGEITTIKKYDNAAYPLLENILIMETVFKYQKKVDESEAAIMSKIVSKNLSEILGVFFFNHDTSEITFRTTLNCLPLNYEVAIPFYLEGENGHVGCQDRFLNN